MELCGPDGFVLIFSGAFGWCGAGFRTLVSKGARNCHFWDHQFLQNLLSNSPKSSEQAGAGDAGKGDGPGLPVDPLLMMMQKERG
jgi:hypothetical protein